MLDNEINGRQKVPIGSYTFELIILIPKQKIDENVRSMIQDQSDKDVDGCKSHLKMSDLTYTR